MLVPKQLVLCTKNPVKIFVAGLWFAELIALTMLGLLHKTLVEAILPATQVYVFCL